MKENLRLYSIRGAVCAENTVEDIIEKTGLLLSSLFRENSISSEENIVSLIFSMTKDLDAINAASAFRKNDYGFDIKEIPLWTSQEAEVKGLLPKTIRCMINVYLPENSKITRLYLNGAEKLRPDLKK